MDKQFRSEGLLSTVLFLTNKNDLLLAKCCMNDSRAEATNIYK